MRRSLKFRFSFADERKFDFQKNPVAVGGQVLVEPLLAGLKKHVQRVTGLSQRSLDRWDFSAEFDHAWFYHVLKPVEEAYLLVEYEFYFSHLLLMKRPKRRFENYLSVLTDVLHGIPQVSDICLVHRMSSHPILNASQG